MHARPSDPIWLSLNIIRFLSIAVLLLVFSSSIVTLVDDIKTYNNFISARQAASLVNPVTGNVTYLAPSVLNGDYIEGSTVPNQPAGIFGAILNRLLIIFQVIVLVLSEISMGYLDIFFDRFFPVLGTSFGVGALGVFQCLIGASVLSHHVDKLALVSALFLFSLGCLNMLVGLIFREKAKAKRSWISNDRPPSYHSEKGVPGPDRSCDRSADLEKGSLGQKRPIKIAWGAQLDAKPQARPASEHEDEKADEDDLYTK